MSVESWDWSVRIFDHVDVHASDYAESVRFYETVLAPLGIPKLAEGDARDSDQLTFSRRQTNPARLDVRVDPVRE